MWLAGDSLKATRLIRRNCLLGLVTVAVCGTVPGLGAQSPSDSSLRLFKLAQLHDQNSRSDSALRYYFAALQQLRNDGARREEAVTLNNIGLVYDNLGHRDSALAYFRESLALSRAIGNRATESGTLGNIASLYANTGRRDSALVYFHDVLGVFRALRDRESEGVTLNNIGAVHNKLGQRDSALVYFLAALSIERARGDRRSEGATLSNVGLVYGYLGRRDSALVYLREALPINRAVGDRPGEAATLGNTAGVFDELGRRDSALAYFRQALAIQQSIRDRPGEASTLTSIGFVFGNLGQPDSALAYYRLALPIRHAVGDRGGEALTLSNIAALQLDAGQRDSALSSYLEVLPVLRRVGDRISEAITFSNIGLIHDKNGRPDSALAYFHAALRMQIAARDRSGTAVSLVNIGGVYHRLAQRDSALKYYSAALSLARAVGQRATEATILENFAGLFAGFYAAHMPSREDRLRALAYFDSAAARWASLRSQSGGDFNVIAFAESQRYTFQGWAQAWLGLAEAAAGLARDTAIESALGAAERGRAQGLRDLLRERSGAREGESARRQASDIGASAETSGLAGSDTLPGGNLLMEARRALAGLRQSKTGLVYFLLSKDTLNIWTLNGQGELRVLRRTSLSGDSLAALVTTLRRGMGADRARGAMARGGAAENADQERTRLSRGVEDNEANPALTAMANRALSFLLLPPEVGRELAGVSEVVIVPQGVLGLVPFAALTAAGDTMPFGIHYSLRYSPSLRALEMRESGNALAGLHLIVGDPKMPTVSDAFGKSVTLRDLPAAKAEAAAVAKRFATTALTGGAATETAIRRELPKARLIHLATHGLAFGSAARVRNSYVALAPDSTNDGLLTIGELLDEVPPLSADLVVLSACQTGLGDLKQAEGTVGFQRAFLAKGARSVLVSLWSVDDEATALLMGRFYAHWLGPDLKPAVNKAEALRRAQSDVRSTKGYESPKNWAAFQLVGAR
jgi:CHAT domain-containing protein/tetratricopeptide (TPR) repeat protein